MTLHWVSLESSKPISIVLDFLNVFPGEGVGKLCDKALFSCLKSFKISSRLISTKIDGAIDAEAASKELARLLYNHHGIEIFLLHIC